MRPPAALTFLSVALSLQKIGHPCTSPTNFAENCPQIDLGRPLINIKSNLINSGMQTDTNNLIMSQIVLFSIPTPNYKIIEAPSKPEYMSIVFSKISKIELRIVDERNRLYDFKGEEIDIELHIKQV